MVVGKNRKIKLLFSNEGSCLETGFSKIGREMMYILHDMGCYDIVELASYVGEGDKRIEKFPWRIYPVVPPRGTSAYKQYERQFKVAQFGALRFNSVMVIEKVDFCVDIRDFWMLNHIFQSPYRNNFRFVIRPPVDGEPQDEEWIHCFKTADVVFSHSRWGKKILESEGVKVDGILYGCINSDNFKPLNKIEMRKKYKLQPDLKIILSVMRNQARKQFPELLQAYALFKKKYPETFEHSVLLLHTSYPDTMGWDLPQLLRRYGLVSDVIFTNYCLECGKPSVTFLQKDYHRNNKNICFHCDKYSAVFPSTNRGVSEQELNEIYNLADLYVQLAGGEGSGLPAIEAKATGLPVICCPYSAMEDHVLDPGGIGLKIKGYYVDWPQMINRVLPDIEDLAAKFDWFFKLSKEERIAVGKPGIDFVKNNYNYKLITQRFHEVLQNTPLLDRSQTWDAPMLDLSAYKSVNEKDERPDIDNYSFVEYLYKRIFNRQPEKYGMMKEYLDALNTGKMKRSQIALQLKHVAELMCKLEMLRVGAIKSPSNINKDLDDIAEIAQKHKVIKIL
jgi:glycosyltransferase involved in cell wall biosynthesis